MSEPSDREIMFKCAWCGDLVHAFDAQVSKKLGAPPDQLPEFGLNLEWLCPACYNFRQSIPDGAG